MRVSFKKAQGAMREVILDTETTGLDPSDGHRVVEIGCVELFNAIPTGKTFHVYVNPERDVPEQAFRVHGLSGEFLADKPVFASIAEEFLAFVDGAKIIAHNAEFDLRFLNAELAFLELEPIREARVIDTLALARRKFPGAANSLDALCLRYGIDASRRTKHGALLDAEILAEVYAELTGGRQASLALSEGAGSSPAIGAEKLLSARPRPLPMRLSVADLEVHRAFVDNLAAAALWNLYYQASSFEEAKEA